MLQYTNSVHISMNDTRTEVVLNFLLDHLDTNNERHKEPVADLIMSGEMAKKLVDLISELMNTESSQNQNPPQ